MMGLNSQFYLFEGLGINNPIREAASMCALPATVADLCAKITTVE